MTLGSGTQNPIANNSTINEMRESAGDGWKQNKFVTQKNMPSSHLLYYALVKLKLAWTLKKEKKLLGYSLPSNSLRCGNPLYRKYFWNAVDYIWT